MPSLTFSVQDMDGKAGAEGLITRSLSEGCIHNLYPLHGEVRRLRERVVELESRNSQLQQQMAHQGAAYTATLTARVQELWTVTEAYRALNAADLDDDISPPDPRGARARQPPANATQ